MEAACLVGGLGEARRKLSTEIHNPAIRNKNTDLRLIQGNYLTIEIYQKLSYRYNILKYSYLEILYDQGMGAIIKEPEGRA